MNLTLGTSKPIQAAHTTDKPVDTLSIALNDIQTLIEKLDKISHRATLRSGRAALRMQFKVGKICLNVQHLDGTDKRYLVAPRDISAKGMGVLYGGYLYPNTTGTLELPLDDGSIEFVPCRVVHSEPVSGRIHYVGLASEDPIDVDWLLQRFQPRYLNVNHLHPNADSILILGYFEQDMFVSRMKQDSQSAITLADNLSDALSHLNNRFFDCLVFEIKFLKQHMRAICNWLQANRGGRMLLGMFIYAEGTLIPLESVLKRGV